MVGVSIGGIYEIATRFFRQRRIQLYRMGNRCRSIHLAATPPSATGRSLATSAHHSFRFLGLAFLVPGVVSPDLPSAFAHPAAYGDFAAAVLALLALISLPSAAGVVIAWIFNLWGAADLFNAFYQANHAGATAGQFGAAYFIPALLVPLLLITHGLGLRILLRHKNESVMREGRQTA